MLSLLLFALMARKEPVSVTPPSMRSAKEPQVAIEGRSVFVAYGMGDAVFVSSSSDGGANYGSPAKVCEAGKLSLGMRRGPRIVLSSGVLTITATYGRAGGGKDGDLLAWRSLDQGKTWTGPSRVNDVEGAAREGLHAMAVSPTGTVACAWLDLRSKGTKICIATSGDGGGTWSPNRLAYASPSGTICQCCHPSLAFDRNGRLYVMFRNVIDGARDMWLASTLDNGATWARARKLGGGTWMLDACPMDGGALAVDSHGEIQTVWRRDGSIFECGTIQRENSLGEGRQPWIACGQAGWHLIWTASDQVWLQAPGERAVAVGGGTDPVIATSTDGKIMVAAWTDGGIRALKIK